MYCSNCGKEMSELAKACPHCGHPNKLVSSGKKTKVVFVLLALFLGGLGIHRMYLGDWLLGIIYLLFCWTFIPAIIALFEAIVIGLRKDDPRFE
jgi:DNA-directed RNA polymerase subunit RPC12/RpoP